MSSTFVTYGRLLGMQLRMSILAAMQYRVGFWSEGIVGLMWSILGIVPLFVALSHERVVAGWGLWELVILTGCFTVVQGVFGALLQPALVASMNHIRRGTLDHILLRPADALFLCLTTQLNPWRFLEIVAGVLLIWLGISTLGVTPTLSMTSSKYMSTGLPPFTSTLTGKVFPTHSRSNSTTPTHWCRTPTATDYRMLSKSA